jgi:hypothetical protein
MMILLLRLVVGSLVAMRQRRLGLADARNIVALALDREERDVGDRRRIDPRPRCIISPLGSEWRWNTTSIVWR